MVWGVRKTIKYVIFIFVLIVVLLSLPSVAAQQSCVRTPIDIVFALDSSGSMLTTDPQGLRRTASKNFVDRLNASIDQAGVVSWDDNIDFVQQLTNDLNLVKQQIDRVDSSGGTNLDVGLRASLDELTSPRARQQAIRIMIFLTDGGGSYTPSGQPNSQADRARAASISIFTIGLSIAPGSVEERNLQEIATVTGGIYFPAPTANALDQIFQQIAQAICRVPVLLVHGIFGSETTWDAARFRGAGFDVYVLDYSGRIPRLVHGTQVTPYPHYQNRFPRILKANADIKIYSAVLHEAVQQIKTETRNSQVDIVAHSMGGLIARWCINKDMCGRSVRKLVMISTPNHGADLYVLRYSGHAFGLFAHGIVNKLLLSAGGASLTEYLAGKAAEQMGPHSRFLEELNRNKGAALHRVGTDYLNPAANTRYSTISGNSGIPTLIHVPLVDVLGFELQGPFLDEDPTNTDELRGGDGVVHKDSLWLDTIIPHYSIWTAFHVGEGINAAILTQAIDLLNRQTDEQSAGAGVLQTINTTTHALGSFEGISSSSLTAHSFVADSSVEKLVFLLAWTNTTNDLNLTLRSPSGVAIDHRTVRSDVTHVQESQFEMFDITLREPGNWTATIVPSHVAGQEPYSVHAYEYSQVFIAIGMDNTSYTSGQRATVLAAVRQGATPILNAIARANITKPDGLSEVVQLFDDGQHGDLQANDGFYGNFYAGTNLQGLYVVVADAQTSIGGTPFTRFAITQFFVEQLPDITPLELSFSNSTPMANQPIDVRAIIRNIGQATAYNVTVHFYDGLPIDNGRLIGDVVIPRLLMNEETQIMVPWVASPVGAHNMTVLISPFNDFFDANYGNDLLMTVLRIPVAQSLATCRALGDWGQYTLVQDLAVSNGSCLTILAANMTIDCQGHTIRGIRNGTRVPFVGISTNFVGRADTTIRNCRVDGFDYGIRISGLGYTITNNTATNTTIAFSLGSLQQSNITGNTALSSGTGFGFFPLRASFVNNNRAFNNSDGFLLRSDTAYNVIEGNDIRGNAQGIRSSGNRISSNTIRSNTFRENQIGIIMESGWSNPGLPEDIYDNIFNNTLNAHDAQPYPAGQENHWNTARTPGTNIIGGPFMGGNFWHDYQGVDVNGDGFGDTMLPYTLNGNIVVGGDFFPLVPLAPTFTVFGTPAINSTVTFQLRAGWLLLSQYILAFSLGNSPGISLPDGRTLRLNPDPLLLLTLQAPQAIGLINNIGFLNLQGQATVTWQIPDIEQLAGLTVYAAYVTINPFLPVPVSYISPTIPLTLRSRTNCVNPPPNMIGWWPGDDDGRELIANNSVALQNGASFSPGLVVRAFNFDGVDDFANTANNITITNSRITVDAWINPRQVSLFQKILKVHTAAYRDVWIEVAQNKVNFAVYDTSGTNHQVDSGSTINPNMWYHIAGTYDGNVQRLYINGVLAGSQSWSGSFDFNDLGFMGRDHGNNHHFDGLIDEVEVFDRALSVSEIQSIVNAGSAGKCKPS